MTNIDGPVSDSDEGVRTDFEKIVWWKVNETGIITHQSDTISRFILLVYAPIEEIKKIDSVNYGNQKLAIMQCIQAFFHKQVRSCEKLRDTSIALLLRQAFKQL